MLLDITVPGTLDYVTVHIVQNTSDLFVCIQQHDDDEITINAQSFEVNCDDLVPIAPDDFPNDPDIPF